MSGNHLHIAREGYDDKFAIEIPDNFVSLSDPIKTLTDFLNYCKVNNSFELEIMGAL